MISWSPRLKPSLALRTWIALCIGVLLAYGLRLYGFAYFWTDDFNNLYWVQQLSGQQMLGYVLHPFSTYFRPAGMAFYWWLLRCCDLDPVPYHTVAWSLHAINTCLVYLLLRRIVRSDFAAAVGAALFTFQALFAEIYWSFGTIFEILSTLLFLLALLLYLSLRPGIWRAIVVLLLYVFALKAKESAITLPLILLLSDALLDSKRPRVRQWILTVAPMLLYAAWFYLKKSSGLSVDTSHPYFMDFSPGAILYSYAWYVYRLIYGNLLYGLAALLALAVAIRSSGKRTLFFGAYAAITLLPVIFLVNHRYEFYWYLPFLGVAGIAALCVERMERWFTSRVRRETAFVSVALLFPVLCREHYFLQKSEGAGDRWIFHEVSDRHRAFVADLRALRKPAQDEVVYFNTIPPNFSPEILLSTTQVALRRTDVPVEFTPSFPEHATYRLSFHDERLDAAAIVDYRRRYSLSVSAEDVVAGRDSYTISIRGLHHEATVKIRYRLNDGPDETFIVMVDSNGEEVLPVSAGTPKGVYRFRAFTFADGEEWIDCDATVRVR